MAEQPLPPPQQPLADGVIPETIVARTEKRWIFLMATMLGVMMLVVVITGVVSALQPPSHVEVIDSQTLHLGGEFAESNLGTAIGPDGSAIVRIVALQYDFVPSCVRVPVDRPVTFRLTSADVVHGFLLPDTNVNTMVMPGFVSEVRTRFAQVGEYVMPCHEFCGLGHHAMWTRVRVEPADSFAALGPRERTSCAPQ